MQKINVSEFKAVCLALLERVRKDRQPVEILKNGKPLAIVYPPAQEKQRSFGALRNSLSGPLGDLVNPVEGMEWEALK